MFGDIGRQAHVDAVVGERQGQPGSPHEGPRPATADPAGGVHLSGVGFDPDVVPARVGERARKITRTAADIEDRSAPVVAGLTGPPQIGHHCRGVGGQCVVKKVRVALLVPELPEQSRRPGQGCPPGEQVGDGHRRLPCQI